MDTDAAKEPDGRATLGARKGGNGEPTLRMMTRDSGLRAGGAGDANAAVGVSEGGGGAAAAAAASVAGGEGELGGADTTVAQGQQQQQPSRGARLSTATECTSLPAEKMAGGSLAILEPSKRQG